MSKKTAIFILVLVVVLGTGILYFFLRGPARTITEVFNGSPFGTPPAETTGTSTPAGSRASGTSVGGRPLAKFFKIAESPVAGYVSILKNGSEVVRYVDRATGHVYDVNPNTLEKTEILNTTDPRIYEALWKPDGSGYIARTLPDNSDVVTTEAIALATKATSTSGFYSAQSTLLRGDIGEIAIMPDGSLLYVLSDSGSIVLAGFGGEKPRTVSGLPFTQWRIAPISAGHAVLTTRASEAAAGYAYSLDLKSGSLGKLIGPQPDLMVLPSPDGKRLALSALRIGKLSLSVLNLGNNVSEPLDPAALPEKCAWSKKIPSVIICGSPVSGLGSGAPDLWYQGAVHYSDRVWRFNTDTGTAELLLDTKKDFDTDIDIFRPALSPDEDYIFFEDKDDLSLWALKLS